jgi:hypothetical protein
MAVTRRRRAPTPSHPCCPNADDLVVLAMANPMFEAGTTRGLRRIRSDGTSIGSEYVEPYGYVIPRGKCLVITDLSYYSGFTQPLGPGNLTTLTLGIVKVSSSGWQQNIIFVTTPQVDWQEPLHESRLRSMAPGAATGEGGEIRDR